MKWIILSPSCDVFHDDETHIHIHTLTVFFFLAFVSFPSSNYNTARHDASKPNWILAQLVTLPPPSRPGSTTGIIPPRTVAATSHARCTRSSPARRGAIIRQCQAGNAVIFGAYVKRRSNCKRQFAKRTRCFVFCLRLRFHSTTESSSAEPRGQSWKNLTEWPRFAR